MRGHLTIVAGPSGAGKSTLIKRFLGEFPEHRFPTSATTREPREGEVHGHHYYFIDRDTFREYIDEGRFLEWAAVYGKYYGTLKTTILEALDHGDKLLKDIDIQGAEALMKLLDPSDITTIFISPPSLDTLIKRLVTRDSENPETLANRLAEAEVEMAGADRFQHILVNEDLEVCYEEFKSAVLGKVRAG